MYAQKDAWGWYREGKALYRLGEYQEALVSLENALAIDTEDADIWYERGNVLRDLGYLTAAVDSYERALACCDSDYWIWYQRGNILNDLGRYREAIDSYERALACRPNDYWAWYDRAQAASLLSQYQIAIDSLDRALQVRPEDYWAWYQRGCVCLQLGYDFPEAIASFDRALLVRPEDYWSWYRRGQALERQLAYPEAAASYQNALRQRPDDFWAQYGFARIQRSLGAYRSAVNTCDRILYWHPRSIEIWYEKAVALYFGQYSSQALAICTERLPTAQFKAPWWHLQGKILAAMGDTNNAIACFEEALATDAGFLLAWYDKSWLLHVHHNLSTIFTSCDRAIALHSENFWAWYQRGLVCLHWQRYHQARYSLHQAKTYQPDSHSIWEENQPMAFWQIVEIWWQHACQQAQKMLDK